MVLVTLAIHDTYLATEQSLPTQINEFTLHTSGTFSVDFKVSSSTLGPLGIFFNVVSPITSS